MQLIISQHLLSEDVVMAAQSSYHRNCLILRQVRLMDVKTLVLFCESLKTNENQKSIAETLVNGKHKTSRSLNMFVFSALEASAVMSSTSSTDDDKSTQPDNLAPLQKVAREDAEAIWNVFEPSFVASNFFDMTIQLTGMLQSIDSKIICDTCNLLRVSDKANIPLFFTRQMEAFKGNTSTTTLVQKVASFTNWMDHSILTAVVKACSVPEAIALLKKFDARIDTSQPVTKYPIPSPSHHMVPYDTSTHTVLAVQLNLQLHHSTLQNVLDTRLLVQEKCEVTPHSLQLLAVAKTSHTIIYWTIPKHVASLITSNALQNQHYFHQNGVQQVAVYPGTVFATGSSLTVGPFSFFNKVS